MAIEENEVMEAALLQELQGIESSLFGSLRDSASLHNLNLRLERLSLAFHDSRTADSISPSTKQSAADLFSNCHSSAQVMLLYERSRDTIMVNAEQDYKRILAAHSSQYPTFPSQQKPKKSLPKHTTSFTQEVDCKAWRIWFLQNLANPYPSEKDKTSLLQATPGKDRAQLLAWMSNIRKRSGWTDLYRIYGGNSVVAMQAFLEKADSAMMRGMVSADALKMLDKVRRYVDIGGREAAFAPAIETSLSNILGSTTVQPSASLFGGKSHNKSNSIDTFGSFSPTSSIGSLSSTSSFSSPYSSPASSYKSAISPSPSVDNSSFFNSSSTQSNSPFLTSTYSSPFSSGSSLSRPVSRSSRRSSFSGF